MTKSDFLKQCAGKKNNRGFCAYVRQEWLRSEPVHRVYLDPGVGFPSGHALLYTSRRADLAVNAKDRFNMWLIQTAQYRPKPSAE